MMPAELHPSWNASTPGSSTNATEPEAQPSNTSSSWISQPTSDELSQGLSRIEEGLTMDNIPDQPDLHAELDAYLHQNHDASGHSHNINSLPARFHDRAHYHTLRRRRGQQGLMAVQGLAN
ncbi:hypothetical protein T439DRAFT_351126 [Meredithblackwellia eburnea MCA 4105]